MQRHRRDDGNEERVTMKEDRVEMARRMFLMIPRTRFTSSSPLIPVINKQRESQSVLYAIDMVDITTYKVRPDDADSVCKRTVTSRLNIWTQAKVDIRTRGGVVRDMHRAARHPRSTAPEAKPHITLRFMILHTTGQDRPCVSLASQKVVSCRHSRFCNPCPVGRST